MEFIRGIPLEAATGKVRKLYEDDMRTLGYVANSTKVFALRPEVHAAWLRVVEAIRTKMEPRRYELIALAVESQLRADALKPGREISPEELVAIARDHGYAPLTAAESMMMVFTARVTFRAHTIHDAEITALRAQGFSDAEILDIGLAASARSFWSKTLDAVGGEPDERYMTLDEGFRRAVVTARPVETAGTTLAVPVRAAEPFQPRVGGHARLWRRTIAAGLVVVALGGLVGVGVASRVSLQQYVERLKTAITPASPPAAAPAPETTAVVPAQPPAVLLPVLAPTQPAAPEPAAVVPAQPEVPKAPAAVPSPPEPPKTPAVVATPPEPPKVIPPVPPPVRIGGPGRSAGPVARTGAGPAAKASAVRPAGEEDEPKGDAADRGPDPMSVRDFLQSLSPKDLGSKE